MPFKLHSKGRRYIPRQHHRVTNWREYDASLRNRGSLTIWFTPHPHARRLSVALLQRCWRVGILREFSKLLDPQLFAGLEKAS